ncbi:hypothetical protein M426DRAFT_317969 [Hypoxylon sp. CI-4A]|nr:hypothetical protein M426DRAFT_317969 [Hypoxylon sp. CI-4A]
MQFTVALALTAFAGLSLAAPALENRQFTSGQCGIHVVQYQKNENGVGENYKFDISIVDAQGTGIGQVLAQEIPDFQSASIPSQLPYTITVTAGSVDDDPVNFAYAGYAFSSSSGCSTGGYQNGNRDMDCGFSCYARMNSSGSENVGVYNFGCLFSVLSVPA